MITAADVMTRNVVTVKAATPVAELAVLLRTHRFSGFPVLDDDDRAVGLISQNDVLRALALALGDHAGKTWEERRRAGAYLLDAKEGQAMRGLLSLPVADLMTAGIHSCTPETPLADVCRKMEELRIHRVVVLDTERRIVGIVSALDVVKRFREELERKA